MSNSLIAAIIIVNMMAYFLGRWMGIREGKRREWARCSGLCWSALQHRWSGSVRWVYNAISDHRENLLPVEEFFDDEPKTKKKKRDEDEHEEEPGDHRAAPHVASARGAEGEADGW